MALATGFLQHLDYGATSACTASVGKVNAGTWRGSSAVDYDLSITGLADPRFGMVEPGGNCTCFAAGGIIDLLKTYGLRTNMSVPALTAVRFEGGSSNQAFLHYPSYISRWSLEGRIGQTLTASMDWLTTTPANLAVPGSWQASDATETFQWFHGTSDFKLDTEASLLMSEFRVEVDNQVTLRTNLDGGKTADQKRFPAEVTVGSEIVTGSFTVGLPPGSDGLAESWHDAPSGTVTAAIIFQNAASKLLTCSLGNLTIGDWSFAYVAPNDVEYFTIPYTAKPNRTDSVALSYA